MATALSRPFSRRPGTAPRRRSASSAFGSLALLALLCLLAVTTGSCTNSRSAAGSDPATSAAQVPTTNLPSTTAPPPTTLPPGTAPVAAPAAPAPASTSATLAPGSCHFVDGGGPTLPDPECTPGATDPRVTQSDISSTICTKGYTDTVRPPESVTEPQKFASMRAYDVVGTASEYEYDHLVPLEIGGAPDATANLWPEELSGPYGATVKDKLENELNSLVCDGQISLASAQAAIATNWIAAYHLYVGH